MNGSLTLDIRGKFTQSSFGLLQIEDSDLRLVHANQNLPLNYTPSPSINWKYVYRMCRHVCMVFAHVHGSTCANILGVFLNHSSPVSLRQGLPLNLELTKSNKSAAQWTLGILLAPLPQSWKHRCFHCQVLRGSYGSEPRSSICVVSILP